MLEAHCQDSTLSRGLRKSIDLDEAFEITVVVLLMFDSISDIHIPLTWAKARILFELPNL